MKNKKFHLAASLVTLLPMVIGLVLWDKLPDKLPIHFGSNGADAWGGKGFAVCGVPVMMLAFYWICYGATLLDKQNRGHNRKVLDLVALIFPGMSLVFGLLILGHGLDIELNMTRILFPMLGLLFILLGNWLPKIKQNATLGIKLPWTLYNEENWNRTHRVGGYTWVLGGILFCVMGFVPGQALLWLMPAVLVLLIGVPMFYSWHLAKKQKAQGRYTESQVSQNLNRHPAIKIVSIVAILAVLGLVAGLMFLGDIEYQLTDTQLLIEADFWDDAAIDLAQLDSVEYRQDLPAGSREWGYGSAKLVMGFCSSEELGDHTRYTYTGTDACILLRSGDDLMILNARTEAETEELYAALSALVQEG